ncbi:uncharacterized protein [Drosophila virilis]|uniref:Uncharacterized protein, isoform B n=2 Tax=Drosophila virilis TaxID=7244 RepID=A0A0Q9WJQ3_DROVI|nr:uncharacterized protein LOC6631372 isoform X1 [Drosophila virilis]XP_032296172.1 uncharacterized protein LOC116652223 isoform X1 [Drosophila virilis]KRF82263.1 uncharacterized protein Dvir_GJ18867, isoform B [Drosophila virilis]
MCLDKQTMSSMADFVLQFLRRTKSGFMELFGQRRLTGTEQQSEDFVPELLDMRQLELREQAQEMEMDLYTISSSDDDEVEYYIYNQDENINTTREIDLTAKKFVRPPVGYHCK